MEEQLKNLLDSEIQADILKRLELRKQVNKFLRDISNLNADIKRKNKAKYLFLGIKEPKLERAKKEKPKE